LEDAAAGTQQHAHVIPGEVRDSEVERAVPVEVACGDRLGLGGRGVADRGLEGTVAAAAARAQQHGHVVAADVRDGEVEFAVPVEVGRGYRIGSGANGVDHRCLEGAAASAQQHAYVVTAAVRDGEIESAVPVEIARGDEEGPTASGI